MPKRPPYTLPVPPPINEPDPADLGEPTEDAGTIDEWNKLDLEQYRWRVFAFKTEVIARIVFSLICVVVWLGVTVIGVLKDNVLLTGCGQLVLGPLYIVMRYFFPKTPSADRPDNNRRGR